jgi:hypothetical protein
MVRRLESPRDRRTPQLGELPAAASRSRGPAAESTMNGAACDVRESVLKRAFEKSTKKARAMY